MIKTLVIAASIAVGIGAVQPQRAEASAHDQVALGLEFGCAIVGGNHDGKLPGGALYCWRNWSNAAPVTNLSSGVLSVAMSGSLMLGHHNAVCALKHNASLSHNEMWCFGANDRGQLDQGCTVIAGPGGDPECALTENYTPTLTSLVSPSGIAGTSMAPTYCAISNDPNLTGTGSLVCWGYNEEAQLGRGTTDNAANNTPGAPTIPAGMDDSHWNDIAANDLAFCARYSKIGDSHNGVWCWGYNPYGGLGDGTAVFRKTMVKMLVSIDGFDPSNETQMQGSNYAMCMINPGNAALYCAGSILGPVASSYSYGNRLTFGGVAGINYLTAGVGNAIGMGSTANASTIFIGANNHGQTGAGAAAVGNGVEVAKPITNVTLNGTPQSFTCQPGTLAGGAQSSFCKDIGSNNWYGWGEDNGTFGSTHSGDRFVVPTSPLGPLPIIGLSGF